MAATRPEAVVVVSHLGTHRRSAISSLRTIADTGYHPFYAGNAFLDFAARVNVPGTYLGGTIAGAAVHIRRHLSVTT